MGTTHIRRVLVENRGEFVKVRVTTRWVEEAFPPQRNAQVKAAAQAAREAKATEGEHPYRERGVSRGFQGPLPP